MKTSALAVRGSAPFVSIWMIDFEFNGGSGEKPDPLCLVAHELQSGQTLTFWRDELRQMQSPPFSTGADTLVVSFYASAEIGCFIALGWKPPENLLDLYVENIASRNGLAFPTGRGLLGALAMRGLSHMSVGEKEDMRDLILNRAEWSPDERASIIEYCRADVGALTALYAAMEHQIDFPRALLRGRYMTSVAHVEANGVPIDGDLFARLCNNWESIKLSIIEAVDMDYGVYRDGHFRKDLFQAFLQREAIPWPRLPSGEMALDRETFRSQARAYPVLRTLYELRVTLDELRLSRLTVGKDGRNRYLLSPFGSVTGRNQPSNSKAIFGPARWIRGLIKPPPKMAIGYIDYSSQEIGIAAALSGDELLMEAYRQGDPYLAFAKQARLVPQDATKKSHKAIRDRCKALVLGINYGMSEQSLARSSGITVAEARELMRLHRETYRRFWAWSDAIVSSAMLTNKMTTCFGWPRHIGREVNPRSLQNWPMQAHGAEMLRLAMIGGVEVGIKICAPVHDAILIAAPLGLIEDHVHQMRDIMRRASRAVLEGFEIRTDAVIVKYPERYMDERGSEMWERIMRLLEPAEGSRS